MGASLNQDEATLAWVLQGNSDPTSCGQADITGGAGSGTGPAPVSLPNCPATVDMVVESFDVNFLPLQALFQGNRLEEFIGHYQLPVDIGGVMKSDDIGMRQAGVHLDLAQKAIHLFAPEVWLLRENSQNFDPLG